MKRSGIGILAVALMVASAAVLLAPQQAQARHGGVVVSVGAGWGGLGFVGGWYTPRVYVPYYVSPSPTWVPTPYYDAPAYGVPYYYAPQVYYGWGGRSYHHHYRR